MLAKEGFDGHEVHERQRAIPGTRQVQVTSMRCRPGTFEHRYGRAQPGSTLELLFQAGCEFGLIWEKAGLDGPGTVEWGKVGSTPWQGLPNARVAALDDCRRVWEGLGDLAMGRMVNYVVQGRTSRELSKTYGREKREMSAILDSDLHRVAEYFGLLTTPR